VGRKSHQRTNSFSKKKSKKGQKGGGKMSIKKKKTRMIFVASMGQKGTMEEYRKKDWGEGEYHHSRFEIFNWQKGGRL